MTDKQTHIHTSHDSGLSGRRVKGRERGLSAEEQYQQLTDKLNGNLKATIHQYRKWLRLATEARAGEGEQERTIQKWIMEMHDLGRRGDRETIQLLLERSVGIDGERPPYQERPTHGIAEGSYYGE